MTFMHRNAQNSFLKLFFYKNFVRKMLTFEHLRCTINMTSDLTAYARCIKLNDWWQMEAAKIIISQRVEDDKEPLSEFVPKSPLSCYGAWKNRMVFLYWVQARCQIGWRKEGDLCIVLPCWQNRKQSGSATPSKLSGFVKRRGCFRRSCNMTIRNVFWNVAERCSNQCRHCTFRGGRVECGGAPSFSVSKMWNHLVQWPWFFASCVQAEDRLFFMKPVEEQKIKEGLSIWFEGKK